MLAEERLADASGWRNQSPLYVQSAQPAQPLQRVQPTQHLASIGAQRAVEQPAWRVAAQASPAILRAATLRVVTSAALRHWLIEALATVCVLGGVLAAPVLAMVAWVGLLLPTRALLHLAAPTLMIVALVWLIAAILVAHVNHMLRSRRQHTSV